MSSSIRPKQSLGQNFLSDPNTIRKIAEAVPAPSDATVVEIGPGTGALTEALLERYERVVAIEVDRRLVEHLRGRFPGLDVRHQDVLETDWQALAEETEGPVHVVGNLPYYITSPIVFQLIEAREQIESATVMMQLEVAQRFAGEPGTKQYGSPSVLVQLTSEVEVLFRVSRNVFYPKPDVTSAMLQMDFSEERDRLEGMDTDWLQTVVRTAFGKRRKMLRNSLRPFAKDRGIELPNDWGRRRPESLSPEDFLALARYLQEALPDSVSSDADGQIVR